MSARKFDGKEHRSWPARIILNNGPLLVLDALFQETVEHELIGTIASGTISTEYYWRDRWYNVFRFKAPETNETSFYCNVAAPPVFDGQILSYIDLDIDIVVAPDFSCQVLDLEDFEINAVRYCYPSYVQAHARGAVDELMALIKTRAFPFRES